MKKLLALAILFLSGNCFASEEKEYVVSVLAGHCMLIPKSTLENLTEEDVRQSTLKRVEEDLPLRLCAKALKSREYRIAKYLGKTFQIKNWQRSEELCALLDRFSSEKSEKSKKLEEEFVPLVLESMIQKVARGLPKDVLKFIRANSLNEIDNISK